MNITLKLAPVLVRLTGRLGSQPLKSYHKIQHTRPLTPRGISRSGALRFTATRSRAEGTLHAQLIDTDGTGCHSCGKSASIAPVVSRRTRKLVGFGHNGPEVVSALSGVPREEIL